MPISFVPTPKDGWTAGSFLRDVIDPALDLLAIDDSESFASARLMLLGTAVQESLLKHVEQLPDKRGKRGPALGYFQMEPITHNDIWENYLKYKPMFAAQIVHIAGFASGVPKPALLKFHPIYAATMARVHYRRKPGNIPSAGNINGMAAYWKKHYNTPSGKGKESEFIQRLTQATKDIWSPARS